MATLHRAVASLRVRGDDLVPDDVSILLGAEPTFGHVRGQVLTGRSGRTRVAGFGLWSKAAEESTPADLDRQVVELLSALTDDLAVWAHLADRFGVDLFCGWFLDRMNEGVSLSASSLVALGRRGIELDLDIYAP